jgi:hypothetical protein
MTTSEEMVTRRVVLPDGRYLIYYTFEPDNTSVSSEPGPADKELETGRRDEET